MRSATASPTSTPTAWAMSRLPACCAGCCARRGSGRSAVSASSSTPPRPPRSHHKVAAIDADMLALQVAYRLAAAGMRDGLDIMLYGAGVIGDAHRLAGRIEAAHEAGVVGGHPGRTMAGVGRSEERRVGKECVRTWRSRGW